MTGSGFVPFESTPWSLILEIQGRDSERVRDALERLCERYWPPIYSYLRRHGHDDANAKDLAQGLFEQILARDDLRNVDAKKGRFRSYLLASLNHYEANERVRASAMKRGGGESILSLEDPQTEAKGLAEPRSSHDDSDALFDREWACCVVGRAFERLRRGETAAGRGPLFKEIERFILDDSDGPSREVIAARFGVGRATIDTRLSRLKAQLRELLREEMSHLVSDERQIDDEIRYLLQVLSRLDHR